MRGKQSDPRAQGRRHETVCVFETDNETHTVLTIVDGKKLSVKQVKFPEENGARICLGRAADGDGNRNCGCFGGADGTAAQWWNIAFTALETSINTCHVTQVTPSLRSVV